MNFDAADLAIIEISLDVIPEPQRGLIENLIAQVREHEENEDASAKKLASALDDAKDALSILKQVRHCVDGEDFSGADGHLDDVSTSLERIAELEDS